MIFLPEKIIVDYLNDFQDLLKTSIDADFNNNLITEMFGSSYSLGDFNVVEEAKSFFSKERPIEINVGYNISTETNLPTINILYPSSNQELQTLGFAGSEFLDEDEEEQMEFGFAVKYVISVNGNNSDLIVIVSSVLKYMLLANLQKLELEGFLKLRISDSDLNFMSQYVPQNFYSRGLNLDFTYLVNAKNSIQTEKYGAMTIDKESLKI